MRTIFFFLIVLFANLCFGEDVFVELSHAPADGFVVSPMDMTPAANWLNVSRMNGTEFYYGDKKLDAVFVPDPGDAPNRGTFVAILPNDLLKDKPIRLHIEHHDAIPPNRSESPIVAGTMTFDADKQGGLPSTFTFPNRNLDSLKWFDRLHDPKTGGWNLVNDNIELIVDRPFLKVVRTATVFKQETNVPPSKPKAEYQWFIFPQQELVYVTVLAQQDEPTEWQEKHFFELHHPTGSQWFGDDKSGTFTGTQQSQTFSRYAGFLDDSNNVIAAIAPGTIVYDGLNTFGPYLLPRGSDAWKPWSDTKHRLTAWYWIGNTAEPAKTLQAAYETVAKMPQAKIVIPALEVTVKDWKTAALNDLFLSGKIASKEELAHWRNTNRLPQHWYAIENGGLGMILEVTGYPKGDGMLLTDFGTADDNQDKGLHLLALVDTQTNTLLSARESLPLFTVEVFDKETGKTITLSADDDWGGMTQGIGGTSAWFRLSNPKKLPEAKDLEVALMLGVVTPPPPGAFVYYCNVEWKSPQIADRYEFRKITSPQIALRNLGHNMKVFYPHASGVVAENPVGNELHWNGSYPSGWCSMPFTTVYDETKNVGLYAASYDRGGAVKDIHVQADPVSDSLIMRFEHPLPIGSPAKVYGFLEPIHGDWFDAALIYRKFVQKHAQWYPREKLGSDGRTDTPQWMKELCVWAQHWESPEKMPETMRKFTEAFGIPTAVHWYGWHQIPFDNDYPHFFPAKDGFKEAVAEIQKNGDCFVMPYINGHLWDTRDKVLDDFQFTSVALSGTAKTEDGKPYIETYGSKESDGSNVELAAMCPASDVWKNKVTENVLRLLNDCGVAGVYVDQVAAQPPNLCFDKSHGHPLAGGNWWCRAYGDMFGKIRSEMPKDKMLTTECNAEPYINIFDSYLTWHFQCQDQVPAFAAVYGGVVQMFGRAYRGGASQVLADRMKAAQQLVYGEQIGWIDPRVIDDPQRFPFLKEIVQVRYKHRDYFYKGEMIRPPKLLDAIPTVTADWQWSGEWNITTDAVLTGAWRKVDASGATVSAVFFFVNVSEEPITSRVAVRLDEIGLKSEAFDTPLVFAPGVPMAVEVVR